MRWAVIEGNFEIRGAQIVFKGTEAQFTDNQGRQQIGNSVGIVMNDQRFAGGEIGATIEFSEISETNACELLFYFDPARWWFVSAGLGGPRFAYFIRHWDNGGWTFHASSGNKTNLVPKKRYEVTISFRGSQVRLSVDGVDVLAATLPFSLPPSQTGIQCIDTTDIKISGFKVSTSPGQAFVVMQFSSPFNEIYEEVIKSVCSEFGIEAHRADETYGPGLIIADVVREISNSEFVIAEITPPNPNVYYEIGYAHAINKPTILLADSNLGKLPFDISGFRTLFYENSIAGKRKFEEGLRRHVAAIFQMPPIAAVRRP
jgi:hypothetical protein